MMKFYYEGRGRIVCYPGSGGGTPLPEMARIIKRLLAMDDVWRCARVTSFVGNECIMLDYNDLPIKELQYLGWTGAKPTGDEAICWRYGFRATPREGTELTELTTAYAAISL